MQSDFAITIVRAADDDPRPIRLRPGGKRERQLVRETADHVAENLQQIVASLIPGIVDQIAAKGVGVFRTEAHVRAAVSQVLTEKLSLNLPAVTELVADALNQTFRRLKSDLPPQ